MFVTFLCGVLGLVWYLIVSIPDICLLTYFYNDLCNNDILSVVEPTRVKLLNFFYSSIKLYVLLNSYLRFITFLYLNVYVLGDDISMS